MNKKYIVNIFYSSKDLKKFQKHLHYNFLSNKKKSQTINYLIKVMLKIKLFWDGETLYETIYKFPLELFLGLKKILNTMLFPNLEIKILKKTLI